jgi:site-specific DNA recombinase
MLRNENYIGVWVWNKTKWLQVPGTNRHKPLRRPESEHVRKEIPELRIIAQELWDRVQTKISRRKNIKARPAGTGKLGSSLLSGLLRCGSCGGSMVVVSRRHKNGIGYANLGCATYRSRGTSICKNGKTISEKKLTTAVVGELRNQLTRPELIDKFVASFSQQFDKVLRGESQELRTLQRQVEAAEKRVRNLTDALGRMGFSEAVATQLRLEEQNVAYARAKLAAASSEGRPKKVVPHPSVVKGYVENLLQVLEGDRTRARELLGRHMPPIVLTAERNGYRLTGGFNLSLLMHEEALTAENLGARSMISGVGGTGIEPATKRV